MQKGRQLEKIISTTFFHGRENLKIGNKANNKCNKNCSMTEDEEADKNLKEIGEKVCGKFQSI